MRTSLHVDLPYGSTFTFGLDTILGHVAVGSNGDVKPGSVGRRDHVLGPVMVDRTGGQRNHRGAGGSDGGLTGDVRKAHHRVAVGHVEVIAHECHAERRIQVGEEDGARFSDAIPIAITQKDDAIGTWHTRSSLLLEKPEEEPLDPLRIIRPLGRVGLGHEHVAVGQHVEPAWVGKVTRERGDA